MRAQFFLRRVLALLVACGFAGLGGYANAQTLVEYSAESRFQMDYHVPDAALAALLPTGWTPSVATQGPAKDANIRVVFIDRMTINGPDGKPVGHGSNRLVYLVAPVKDPRGRASTCDRRPYRRSGGCSGAVRGLPVGNHACNAAPSI